jgi:hypothetical protein
MSINRSILNVARSQPQILETMHDAFYSSLEFVKSIEKDEDVLPFLPMRAVPAIEVAIIEQQILPRLWFVTAAVFAY